MSKIQRRAIMNSSRFLNKYTKKKQKNRKQIGIQKKKETFMLNN